ncbi:hypothetical protein AOPFMNJM_3971 [Methylobacterium jeotgali]|uniref:Phage tail lysozyme domain-containing protein n=3 Tax=Bacteria TaxID=2 RepID=A0ABQ4T2X4_9HYPH|nr:phage tail tip lysozyme [Methylobacterium jeotgali]GJE08628.1 hypothetical protein AOPFMNJM_3971 [Methylobacterium jeotgali]
MSADVLKEFVVSLGWKVDEQGGRKVRETVAGITRSATVLTLALEAAALAAAAAVAKIAANFDTLYFTSQRVGSTARNIQGLSYAFGQVGSSTANAQSAVESFARAMRTNPGVGQFIRDLGVATTQGGKARDSIDVLSDAIDAIQKKHPYYAGAQMASLLGIDEGTYQTLTKYRAEIKRYREEYDQTARMVGLDNEKAAEAGHSFTRSLTTLGALIGAVGQRMLIQFAPALERVVKALLTWVEEHREDIEGFFKRVGDAVEKFTQSLESGNLTKELGFIRDRFVEIGKVIERVISLLGKLGLFDTARGGDPIGRVVSSWLGKGSEVADGEARLNSHQEAQKPGLFTRGLNWLKRKTGIGTPTDAGGGSTAPIGGQTFREKSPGVMQRLMDDFGLTKEKASIVLGNLGHESAGFRAFEEGGGGPGRGWAQWTDPGRKRRFFEYAKQRGLDPRSDEANYGFLKWELQNTHKHAISNLKNATGSEDEMRVFERDFEGAGVKAYGSRFRYAREALKAYEDAQKSKPTGLPPLNFPQGGFSPGGFDVSKATAGAPLGASTTNNSTSNQVTMQNSMSIKIDGSGDPATTGAFVERAMNRSNELSLRNAQTAIR